jgi:multiple sugar transport system permease protein
MIGRLLTYSMLSLRRKLDFINVFVAFLTLILAVVWFMPFVWVFSSSLRPGSASFDLPPRWLPTSFHWENYLSIFTGTEHDTPVPFHLFFWNSFKIASVITVGQLVTCSMGAFAFARLQFPGRDAIFMLLLATLMVPGQVTIIPLFIVVKLLGLMDTHEALIIPSLVSVFGIFLLRQFFLTIPNELTDAARIDGANLWVLYSRIVLPLAGPALSTLAILVFTGSWNEFFRPLIFLNTVDKMTVPLGLVILMGYLGTGSIARVMAGVTLAVIPVLILFLAAQRYIIQGITLTGLKG